MATLAALLPLPFIAADTGSVDVGLFAQYGVLGVLCAGLIWFAKGAYQRERDRADRHEEEIKRLHDLMLDKVVPALTAGTNTIEEAVNVLSSIQREREYAQLTESRRGVKGGSNDGR